MVEPIPRRPISSQRRVWHWDRDLLAIFETNGMGPTADRLGLRHRIRN
jgi:hypothetical protein